MLRAVIVIALVAAALGAGSDSASLLSPGSEAFADALDLLARRPVGTYQGEFELRTSALGEEAFSQAAAHIERAADPEIPSAIRSSLTRLRAFKDNCYVQHEVIAIRGNDWRSRFSFRAEGKDFFVDLRSSAGQYQRTQVLDGAEDVVSGGAIEDPFQVVNGSLFLWQREFRRLRALLDAVNPERLDTGGGDGHFVAVFAADAILRKLPRLSPDLSFADSMLIAPARSLRAGGRVSVCFGYAAEGGQRLSAVYADRLGARLLETEVIWAGASNDLPSYIGVSQYAEGTDHVYQKQVARLLQTSDSVTVEAVELGEVPPNVLAEEGMIGSRKRSAVLHMALLQQAEKGGYPAPKTLGQEECRSSSLEISDSVFLLGAVPVGSARAVYSAISNVSSDELELEVRRKDCGCLQLEMGETRLGPGKTTWIKMIVQSDRISRKRVDVVLGAKGNKEDHLLSVELEGVPPGFLVDPKVVDLGTLYDGVEVAFGVRSCDALSPQRVVPVLTCVADGISLQSQLLTQSNGGFGLVSAYDCTVSAHEDSAKEFGFVMGELIVRAPQGEAQGSIALAANLAPPGFAQWPDCFLVFARNAIDASRVVVFGEDLAVIELVVEGQLEDRLRAKWDPKNGSLVVRLSPTPAPQLGLQAGSVLLATSIGWVRVKVMEF